MLRDDSFLHIAVCDRMTRIKHCVHCFSFEKIGDEKIFRALKNNFLNRSEILWRFNKSDMSASCCLVINPGVNFNPWGRQQ